MAFSPETYALLLKMIEEGGGGGSDTGVFLIRATFDGETTTTLDKTWNEINTAIRQGKLCVVAYPNEFMASTLIAYSTNYEEGTIPEVWISDFANVYSFVSDSVDGYPSSTEY